MKCPRCTGIELQLSERQGVEIDYCPQCRGVWLDRGELDKIIERTMPQAQGYDRPDERYQQTSYDHPYQGRHRDDHNYGGHHGHHKRKSWLAELFD